MKVTLTELVQRFALEGGALSNFLTLQLPSGTTFEVEVEDHVVEAIVRESSGQPAAAPPSRPSRPVSLPDAPAVDVTPPPVAFEMPELQVRRIDWRQLPEHLLAPSIRNVFEMSGVESPLEEGDFEKLKLAVIQKLAAKGPSVGEVDWNSGPRRAIESTRRKTVPTDEWGNPMPPGGVSEPDPGETRDEEDEVEQG